MAATDSARAGLTAALRHVETALNATPTGRWLADYIAFRSMSIADLSEEIGVHPNTVSKWLARDTIPPSSALGLTLHWVEAQIQADIDLAAVMAEEPGATFAGHPPAPPR